MGRALTKQQKRAQKKKDRQRDTSAAAKLMTEDQLDALSRKVAEGGPMARVHGLRLQRERIKRRQILGEDTSVDGNSESWRHSPKIGPRGYNVEFGGADTVVGSMVEARGTTDKVKGIFPWSIGAGSPLIGTPVGTHLDTGEPVHIDLTDWMRRGGLITSPIALVLALNGYGKSSLVRRLQTGAVAHGRCSMVLGDCKPDFRVQTEKFGGQVVQVGHDHGQINPLDVGALGDAVVKMRRSALILQECLDTSSQAACDRVYAEFGTRLGDEWAKSNRWQRTSFIEQLNQEAREVRLDVRMRQSMMVASLVQLVRRGRVSDFEETMISSAISGLYDEGVAGPDGQRVRFAEDNPPLLEDLYTFICTPTDRLIEDAGIQPGRAADPVTHQLSAEAEYLNDIKPLRRSLRALIRGEFGEVFNGKTSTRLDLSKPAICVDVSNIPHSEASPLRAAVLMACWGDGFGAVEAAGRLATVGLGPRVETQVIMDELWQVLQASPQMVSKINQLTRLNRQTATELIMITHSIADFSAVENDQAVAEADGLVERSRVKIIGAVPSKEIARLREVVDLSDQEAGRLTSWSRPPGIVGEGVRPGEKAPPPPGTGHFLVKVGERGVGIPFRMQITAAEERTEVHNTNKAYDDGVILPVDRKLASV